MLFCIKVLLSINESKSDAELKASLTVVKEDSHFATSPLPLHPSTPDMNFVMFWHTPQFSFLSKLFSLSERAFIFVFIFVFLLEEILFETGLFTHE